MIRSSIHTNRTFNGLSARVMMRAGTGWDAFVCLGSEVANYQPKQDRNLDPEAII